MCAIQTSKNWDFLYALVIGYINFVLAKVIGEISERSYITKNRSDCYTSGQTGSKQIPRLVYRLTSWFNFILAVVVRTCFLL